MSSYRQSFDMASQSVLYSVSAPFRKAALLGGRAASTQARCTSYAYRPAASRSSIVKPKLLHSLSNTAVQSRYLRFLLRVFTQICKLSRILTETAYVSRITSTVHPFSSLMASWHLQERFPHRRGYPCRCESAECQSRYHQHPAK